MNELKLTPVYLDKTFKSNKHFKEWLEKTTFARIKLAELGQDMTQIYVAESGEILHCNFHESIYKGKFINMKEATVFRQLEILENGKWVIKTGLLIEEVIKQS